MSFQNMYNTFYYGFTFGLWKTKNRGHFAVFAARAIFLLLKRNEKNSEFAVLQIIAAGFDFFL